MVVTEVKLKYGVEVLYSQSVITSIRYFFFLQKALHHFILTFITLEVADGSIQASQAGLFKLVFACHYRDAILAPCT